MASKKKWPKGSQGIREEGLQPMGAILRETRKDELSTRPMSMDEKLKALELFAETQDAAQVAAKLNRSEVSIRKFLRAYQSTATGARMVLNAGAEKLAKRVIREANVEESMEVLDRLDVLPKIDRAKATPQSQFNVIIGMPSAGGPRKLDAVPVPTEAQVQKALEGEIADGESSS